MKIRTLLGVFLAIFTFVAMSGNSYAETKSRKVLDGKARMELPREYEQMTSSMIRKAYPSSDRPKDVWYFNGRDAQALILFSLHEMKGKKIAESNLRTIADSMNEEFGAYSSSVKEGKVNGRKVVWIEIRNARMEGVGKRNMLVQLSVYKGKLLTTTLMVENDARGKYFKEGSRALKTISY